MRFIASTSNAQLMFSRWLDSLIFNDETDAYKSWTLFLIFVAILVLIGGVVLLTHKKPEPKANKVKSANLPRRRKANKIAGQNDHSEEDDDSLVHDEETNGENEALYALGNDSDDEDMGEDDDIDHHQNPLNMSPNANRRPTLKPRRNSRAGMNEHTSLVEPDDIDERDRRRRSTDPFMRDGEEMEEFETGASRSRRLT